MEDFSEKHILDTTSWTEPRITDTLPEFLEKFAFPRRKKRKEKGRTLCDAPRENGSPHTLIIAGAGLRAADLTRVLRVFQTKESMVQKLFAKHVKLKEAVVEVKGTRMGVGVGTPQRIYDLLEDGEFGSKRSERGHADMVTTGALASKTLERIVVDASHIDQKKRGILDMKETVVPLAQLLARPDLKSRYGSGEGEIELVFF